MQRFQYRTAADAANLLDFRAADGLTVGDDSECLQRRCRKTLGTSGKLCAPDSLGVFRASENLPSAGDLDQLDAVAVLIVVAAEIMERRRNVVGGRLSIGRHRLEVRESYRARAREQRRFKQLR